MLPVKSFYIYYFIPIKLFSVVFRTKKLGLESPYELWCNDQITDMDQKIKYWTLMQLQLNVNTVHDCLILAGLFITKIDYHFSAFPFFQTLKIIRQMSPSLQIAEILLQLCSQFSSPFYTIIGNKKWHLSLESDQKKTCLTHLCDGHLIQITLKKVLKM